MTMTKVILRSTPRYSAIVLYISQCKSSSSMGISSVCSVVELRGTTSTLFFGEWARLFFFMLALYGSYRVHNRAKGFAGAESAHCDVQCSTVGFRIVMKVRDVHIGRCQPRLTFVLLSRVRVLALLSPNPLRYPLTHRHLQQPRVYTSQSPTASLKCRSQVCSWPISPSSRATSIVGRSFPDTTRTHGFVSMYGGG